MTLPISHTARITVKSGHLHIETGFPCGTEIIEMSRVDRKFQRILVNAKIGHISIDAIHWLREVGIQLVYIHNGEPFLWTGEPTALTSLRRAQVLARDTATGRNVMRELISAKLRNAADTVEPLNSGIAVTLRENSERVMVGYMQHIRQIEAESGKLYWSAWKAVKPRFDRTVPRHWRTMKQRESLVSHGNYRASDPVNAMLNYSYGILKTLTLESCYKLWLDPYFGLNHTDKRRKVSEGMIYDLMEPARPLVDRKILSLLDEMQFTRYHHVERSDGTVRICEEMSDILSIRIPTVIEPVYSLWEHCAHMLYDALKRRPLTKDNYKKKREH